MDVRLLWFRALGRAIGETAYLIVAIILPGCILSVAEEVFVPNELIRRKYTLVVIFWRHFEQ